MSATTQTLIETIESIEQQLNEVKDSGNQELLDELTNKRAVLVQRLQASNSNLSEGKRMLHD